MEIVIVRGRQYFVSAINGNTVTLALVSDPGITLVTTLSALEGYRKA